MVLTVRGDCVCVGDQLYNRYGYCAAAKWVTVRAVTVHDSGNVFLDTYAWDTVVHPAEGVVVRREAASTTQTRRPRQ